MIVKIARNISNPMYGILRSEKLKNLRVHWSKGDDIRVTGIDVQFLMETEYISFQDHFDPRISKVAKALTIIATAEIMSLDSDSGTILCKVPEQIVRVE